MSSLFERAAAPLALLLSGCSLLVSADRDRVPRDAGETRDGSSVIDGGDVPLDAGVPEDSGAADSGLDAGSSVECDLPAAFDVGAIYDSTLYVAASASSGGLGTPASPMQLGDAAMAATPGTRILVSAGTYTGSQVLTNMVGEAGRPIAIIGDGEVILDVGGSGVLLTSPSYLVLENVTVQNGTSYGLHIDGGGETAHHIVLRDVVIRTIGAGGNEDCLKLTGVDDFAILGGEITGCDGEAIDMVGSHRGVLSGLSIHTTQHGGIQLRGGSSDVMIHGNVFTDVAVRPINMGGATAAEFFRPLDATAEARGIRTIANVFVRPQQAVVAYSGCVECVFANNTIVDPTGWIARILQEVIQPTLDECQDGVFANNLIVFSADSITSYLNVGAGTLPETFTFDHNLWRALDRDGSWAGPTIDGETDSLFQMDPMLVDLAGGDYRLTAESPAIGAGRAVDPLPVYPDADGLCYLEPTIGAYAAP